MKTTYLLMVYFNYPNRTDTYCFEAYSGCWEQIKQKIEDFIQERCSYYDSDLYNIVGLIKE